MEARLGHCLLESLWTPLWAPIFPAIAGSVLTDPVTGHDETQGPDPWCL